MKAVLFSTSSYLYEIGRLEGRAYNVDVICSLDCQVVDKRDEYFGLIYPPNFRLYNYRTPYYFVPSFLDKPHHLYSPVRPFMLLDSPTNY